MTAIAAPTLIALLSDLVKACAGQPALVQTEPRDWFNALLAHQVEVRLPGDQATLARITDAGGQALLAAQAGQSEQARQLVRKALDLLAAAALSAEAHRLARTLICAQHAYVCYRTGDDAQAQALLEVAFRDDLVLEGLHGYGFLQIHRIQLLHNLMRIHRARGRWRQALQLGYALLSHLEHPARQIRAGLTETWGQHWSPAFRDTPPALVTAMHTQIAAEMVSLSRQLPHTEAVAAALRVLPGDILCSQVARWATFEAARLAGATEDALAAAIPLLRHGPLPSGPLWQATAKGTLACLAEQIERLQHAES